MAIQGISPLASKLNFGSNKNKNFSVNAMAPLEVKESKDEETKFWKNLYHEVQKLEKNKGIKTTQKLKNELLDLHKNTHDKSWSSFEKDIKTFAKEAEFDAYKTVISNKINDKVKYEGEKSCWNKTRDHFNGIAINPAFNTRETFDKVFWDGQGIKEQDNILKFLKTYITSDKGQQRQEESSYNKFKNKIFNTNAGEFKKTFDYFEYKVKQAKEAGVDSISVDVWWGKVEKNKDQEFDWSYYDKIFEIITDNGLKVNPILSFHKCGGNVGDDVNIPIPEWSWKYLANSLGKEYKGEETKNELSYKNESGYHSDDVIPVWYDGQMSLQYSQFMKEFKERYEDYGDQFSEINISMGPAGELRLPSYGSTLGFDYPDRGGFIGYSKGGKEYLREFAEVKYGLDPKTVAEKWDIANENFSLEEISPPSKNNKNEKRQADNFVKSKNYLTSQYGKDFTTAQNYALVKHLRTMLNIADEVFKNGPLSKVDIGIKLPGAHWQMGNKPLGSKNESSPMPRITEVATGLTPTSIDIQSKKTGYGYAPILNELKRHKEKWNGIRDLVFHFTAFEFDNQEYDGMQKTNSNSLAKDLVHKMIESAKEKGLTIKGENALAWGISENNPRGWENTKEAIKKGASGMTFLRIGDVVGTENKEFTKFMNWKNENFDNKN